MRNLSQYPIMLDEKLTLLDSFISFRQALNVKNGVVGDMTVVILQDIRDDILTLSRLEESDDQHDRLRSQLD